MSERHEVVLSGDAARAPSTVSRRGAVQASLATAACVFLPSAFDLNGDRTMAREIDAATQAATYEDLVAQARNRAAEPYRPVPDDLPGDLAGLSYDDYTAIRFRPEKTLPLGPRFSLQPFHRGFIQRKRVRIAIRPADGPARILAYDPALFDLGPALQGRSFPASLGFAGFRLSHGFDADRPENHEEFAVFLGASYFRLRGRSQFYGLSARGVAVNTFGPGTEEFPDFTDFWIEAPKGGEAGITVLAMLDGPSIAGAFRFVIEPGDPTRVDVTASLHPRREIARLGLAPLTSMFLFGQDGPGARNATPFDDYRPQVHDSDGLLVATPGERVWRPLVNGRTEPRISAFRTAPLAGFGLLQRDRRFADYLDVQARHEDRPGLWVTPRSGPAFAAGAVQLFEIPSREEIVDNIVAAFVPEAAITTGVPLDLAYGLTTIGAEPVPVLPDDVARAVSTRIGSAEHLRPSNPPAPGRRLYVVDFEGRGLPTDPKTQVDVALSASAGSFTEPYTERVPQTGGWRLYAEYRPPNPLPKEDVVLRATLSVAGKPVTETWDAVA